MTKNQVFRRSETATVHTKMSILAVTGKPLVHPLHNLIYPRLFSEVLPEQDFSLKANPGYVES
jgi:hypothetical protein